MNGLLDCRVKNEQFKLLHCDIMANTNLEPKN